MEMGILSWINNLIFRLLAIVLGVIVVVFGTMYIKKWNDKLNGKIKDLSEQLKNIRKENDELTIKNKALNNSIANKR